MVSPGTAVDPTTESPLADLVPVGVYASHAAGAEHGLVILAMGLPYWMIPAEDRFVLLVARGQEDAATDQLARFDRESVDWPPAPAPRPVARPGPPAVTPLLWALSLLAAFRAQQLWPVVTERGTLEAGALLARGEWWRPVTALFLHADVGHLVSNVVAGVFILSVVLSTFGRRLGWALLAVAAVAGNLAVAFSRFPDPYRSLGASTAIFAGLGLLTGRALPLKPARRGRAPWRELLAPLGAGLTLLALHGAGGERVDLGAHLFGFAAGLLLGVVAGLGASASPADSPAADAGRDAPR